MNLSESEKLAITSLLTSIYQEILAIETEYGLLAGEGDFRPRIEHFHDAIRAFTSQDTNAMQQGGRLSVDWLAYDLSCLKYLTSMPLASFKPHGKEGATATEIIETSSGQPVPADKRPDRTTKSKLSELYQHYSVLFAGLLKPFADNDYYDRSEALEHDAHDIYHLIQQMKQYVNGKVSEPSLKEAINQIEDHTLRTELVAFLQAQKHKQRQEMVKLNQKLKQEYTKREKLITGITKAHMDFGLHQLSIFENSRDMVRLMAARGLNIVGKFVESATAQARRDLGR